MSFCLEFAGASGPYFQFWIYADFVGKYFGEFGLAIVDCISNKIYQVYLSSHDPLQVISNFWLNQKKCIEMLFTIIMYFVSLLW